MAAKLKITKEAVEALEPGQIISDTNPTGFVARCQQSGKVSYFYRYRDKRTGKKHWLGLGVHGDITAKRARELASIKAGEVAGGSNPLEEQKAEREEAQREALADKNTVDAALDLFVEKHAKKLRSCKQVEHAFDSYVRPKIGTMSIYDVKRRHISEMLDAVEKEAGPVMADRTLAHVRKAFNWWATRDDEFSSPIVRGMARTKPKERARKRTLTDEEIRDVWKALEKVPEPACYSRYVKSLLLNMTRRNESSRMTSAELDGDLWTIPGSRYKNKLDHVIPMSAQAKALIGDKPDGFKGNSWFIFSTVGGAKAFSGFSKAKKLLDAEIAKIRKTESRPKMPRWTLHDLRRTARTLMSRAKVPEDHAERAMGHVIVGVRGTYDRYAYLDEKREAFAKLASLVDLILAPKTDNVIPFAEVEQ
ncbi:integrase [Bradyrhizobium elkanii]|uniref:tyrosine-type recombinase/integrase n=1 Tax=Bradyrhizobium elkanii TaxID=29448 RepID=UPI003510E517